MIWNFFFLLAMIALAVMIIVAILAAVAAVIMTGIMIGDTVDDVFRDGEHPKVALKRRVQDIKDCTGGFRSWFRWMWDGWFVEEPKRFDS